MKPQANASLLDIFKYRSRIFLHQGAAYHQARGRQGGDMLADEGFRLPRVNGVRHGRFEGGIFRSLFQFGKSQGTGLIKLEHIYIYMCVCVRVYRDGTGSVIFTWR